MNQFVIDASIVLSWCFPDEDDADAQHAVTLLQKGSEAVATSFWRHEVLNGLLMAERRKRITETLSQTFMRDLQKLPVHLDAIAASKIFGTDVEALARQHALTAYDAAYLELAIRLGIPLSTLDTDLRRAAQAVGVTLVTGI